MQELFTHYRRVKLKNPECTVDADRSVCRVTAIMVCSRNIEVHLVLYK